MTTEKRARTRLEQLRRRREKLKAETERLQAETKEAVEEARDAGIPWAEIAKLAGISRPRVGQLLSDSPRQRGRSR